MTSLYIVGLDICFQLITKNNVIGKIARLFVCYVLVLIFFFLFFFELMFACFL